MFDGLEFKHLSSPSLSWSELLLVAWRQLERVCFSKWFEMLEVRRGERLPHYAALTWLRKA